VIATRRNLVGSSYKSKCILGYVATTLQLWKTYSVFNMTPTHVVTFSHSIYSTIIGVNM